MQRLRYILLIFAFFSLAACGGGHGHSYEEGDGDYHHDDDTSSSSYYIDWVGSVNGTIVVDATNDAFQFEAYSGFLVAGNTTYTNAWVDSYGHFYIDGFLVGGVYYVESSNYEPIAALVSLNGYYIDFYGPESDLAWEESTLLPIYAVGYNLTTSHTASKSTIPQQALTGQRDLTRKGSAPEQRQNVIIEDRPENSTGILKSKP